jgi:hypothetical protein
MLASRGIKEFRELVIMWSAGPESNLLRTLLVFPTVTLNLLGDTFLASKVGT